jgi:catechol 2,3-dioxygenase-like lactoylglutathione lyase family enzyme
MRRGAATWGVVLDAPDARALAQFYARLLGWQVVDDEEDGWATVAESPDADVYIGFQTSPEYRPPTWPPAPGEQQQMLHLDLEVDDLERTVAEALADGATLAASQPQPDVRVMLDPAGHPFCLYTSDAPA